MGKFVRMSVADLSSLVDEFPAGVFVTEGPGDLVKALPCGVVMGTTHHTVTGMFQHFNYMRVSAADDQAQIMGRVADSIKNYINIFNADKRFKLIITSQGYSTLLYADPALDITKPVLNGLNDRYRGNTSAPAANNADTTKAK